MGAVVRGAIVIIQGAIVLEAFPRFIIGMLVFRGVMLKIYYGSQILVTNRGFEQQTSTMKYSYLTH